MSVGHKVGFLLYSTVFLSYANAVTTEETFEERSSDIDASILLGWTFVRRRA